MELWARRIVQKHERELRSRTCVKLQALVVLDKPSIKLASSPHRFVRLECGAMERSIQQARGALWSLPEPFGFQHQPQPCAMFGLKRRLGVFKVREDGCRRLFTFDLS